MAVTPSRMVKLGKKASDFLLTDVMTGNLVAYSDVKGDHGTLVIFLCCHCPYVIHVESEITKVAAECKRKGIGVVGISSNDTEKYPQDGPEFMKEQSRKLGFSFPYLFDQTQEVAKAYEAECTPDLFLFDHQDACYYRGRIDASRPGNDESVTGEDLRNAIDQMLEGEPSPSMQYPSIGCNIKWKG